MVPVSSPTSPDWEMASAVGSQICATLTLRSTHTPGSLISTTFISRAVRLAGFAATSASRGSIWLVRFSFRENLPWYSSVIVFLNK